VVARFRAILRGEFRSSLTEYKFDLSGVETLVSTWAECATLRRIARQRAFSFRPQSRSIAFRFLGHDVYIYRRRLPQEAVHH